jgi:hypothetical protein
MLTTQDAGHGNCRAMETVEKPKPLFSHCFHSGLENSTNDVEFPTVSTAAAASYKTKTK